MIMRLIGSVLLLTAALAGHADADPTWASHVGGTCIPDSETIRSGVHETAGFGVRFSGNHTGRIRLLCPFGIATYDAKLAGTELSVIDSDGMEAGGRIRAHLRRAAFGTNVAVTLATCDSNTSTEKGPHRMTCPSPGVFVTRGSDWYWWEIIIERTTPTVNVEFLGISPLYSP